MHMHRRWGKHLPLPYGHCDLAEAADWMTHGIVAMNEASRAAASLHVERLAYILCLVTETFHDACLM